MVDSATRRSIRWAQAGLLINAVLVAASDEHRFERFRLYEDGWGMPEMRIAGAAEAAFDKIMRPH